MIKIIQLIIWPVNKIGGTDNLLLGLADDGSIWIYKKNENNSFIWDKFSGGIQ